jgi:Domain of unknown function (DUF1905)
VLVGAFGQVELVEDVADVLGDGAFGDDEHGGCGVRVALGYEAEGLVLTRGISTGMNQPPEVVESLAQGKRPRVTITINGHSWRSRVALMRGRFLLGLSNANRQAAGVEIGDEVEVELEFDPEPRVVAEPADFAPRPRRRSDRPRRV